MRRKLIFPVLFLVAVFFTNCQKETIESSDNSNMNNFTETATQQAVDFKPDMEMYNSMYAANEARLAQLSGQASRECVETVMVPDDYSTIQEAIDAVCDGGNVIVKDGTYNEDLVVYKPGLHIKAIGDVTLNGSFFLTPDADDVKIQKFKIVSSGFAAFFANNVEGGEFMHNTVSGTGAIGVIYWRSNGISIKHNHVSGFEWGILSGNWLGDGYTSNYNMILNNTITGITGLSCIGLQGDSDYNMIIGNTVTSNPIWWNAGIMLNSWPGTDECDNNIVKNNIVSANGFNGIWVDDGGSNNTIGPNNTANSNAETGIMLDMFSSNNHVFNNTAVDNTICDIVDEGGTDNTYKNNTAECTSGF